MIPRASRRVPGLPSSRSVLALAFGILVAGGVLVVVAGRTTKAVAGLGLLSLYLSYVLAPLPHSLRRAAHRRRRSLSPTAAIVLAFGLVGGGLAIAQAVVEPRLLLQADLFTAQVPAHLDRALTVTGSLANWQHWFGWSSDASTGGLALLLSDWVRVHVANALRDALDYRWVLPWLWLVPVLSFFLMTQFRTFRRSALRVLPRGHLRWRGHEFLEQVNTVLSGYVRAQILSAVIIGGSAAAGLAMLQVPYALLLGAAAGAMEFVPLLGPAAAALLAASFVRGGRLVAVLTLLAALRILQDLVIYPRLMGRRVHLPSAAVILAVAGGAAVGGILGVLAAVPMVAVGAVALRQWRDYRHIERLVATQGRSSTLSPSPPA